MAETRALPRKRLTLSSGAGVALWLAGPADAGGVPEHLWKALSRGEKDRANRFLRAEDRALFALTRGTLRCLLSGRRALQRTRSRLRKDLTESPAWPGPMGRISMFPIRGVGH